MSQEVEIIARGAVGSGKSALLGEIEILLKAMRVPYRHGDPEAWKSEVNLTGADWQSELERTKPVVVLREERLLSVDFSKPGPIKDAYEEGMIACHDGLDVLQNPFLGMMTSSTAPQALAWMIGYNVHLVQKVRRSTS